MPPMGSGNARRSSAARCRRARRCRPRSTVDDLRPVVVLVRDGDALLGAGEREEAAERGEQLLGIGRIGRRHDRPPSGVPSTRSTTPRVAHPADSRILPADEAETLVDLVDHRLERRLGAVVVERLLQVLAQVVGGCRDDRRRRDGLGELGCPVLGRADSRLRLREGRLHDDGVVLELEPVAAHSGIALSMAAVSAGAGEAPAPAPIDSLSCSLQASSGRSAVYAKPT